MSELTCPNCGRSVGANAADYEDHYADQYGHAEGCALSMLLTVVADRGHDVNDADLTRIDVNLLWDRFLGPAADQVERDLGLTD